MFVQDAAQASISSNRKAVAMVVEPSAVVLQGHASEKTPAWARLELRFEPEAPSHFLLLLSRLFRLLPDLAMGGADPQRAVTDGEGFDIGLVRAAAAAIVRVRQLAK